MTVGELIKKLKDQPLDARVFMLCEQDPVFVHDPCLEVRDDVSIDGKRYLCMVNDGPTYPIDYDDDGGGA